MLLRLPKDCQTAAATSESAKEHRQVLFPSELQSNTNLTYRSIDHNAHKDKLNITVLNPSSLPYLRNQSSTKQVSIRDANELTPMLGNVAAQTHARRLWKALAAAEERERTGPPAVLPMQLTFQVLRGVPANMKEKERIDRNICNSGRDRLVMLKFVGLQDLVNSALITIWISC